MTTEPEVLDPSTVAADEAATRTEAFDAKFQEATGVAPADLPPEVLMRMEIARLKDENAALKKDRAECIELAEEHAAKLRDHEDLKSRAKKAKDEADVLADALSKKVRGEVQTEIDPEDDAEQDTIEFQPGTAPTPNEAANLDAIDVPSLDWSTVERAVLSALMSTGKPQKVVPVPILGLDYVLVDVQDRVAVFHQVMDAETFVNVHKVEGAVRPDERGTALEQLGAYAGIPVKVGRAVRYLGAAPLLIRMPLDAAVSGTPEPIPFPASDDTDAQGRSPVSNRIVAHLKSSGAEFIATTPLAQLLGVERDVVQLAASQDSRLVYEAQAERISLA